MVVIRYGPCVGAGVSATITLGGGILEHGTGQELSTGTTQPVWRINRLNCHQQFGVALGKTDISNVPAIVAKVGGRSCASLCEGAGDGYQSWQVP